MLASQVVKCRVDLSCNEILKDIPRLYKYRLEKIGVGISTPSPATGDPPIGDALGSIPGHDKISFSSKIFCILKMFLAGTAR